MIECDTCGKGFQFQSQLNEHLRTHQAMVTGSVLGCSVGKDLNESWNWMPIYLIIVKPSSNVINAPTKIQILEKCAPIKENTVT